MKKMTIEEMRKENGGCHDAVLYLGYRYTIRNWRKVRALRWRGKCGCTFETYMPA